MRISLIIIPQQTQYTSKEIIPDSIEIHGTTIKRQTEVKLLGITNDQKLKFDKYIDNLCKNTARQINIRDGVKECYSLCIDDVLIIIDDILYLVYNLMLSYLILSLFYFFCILTYYKIALF